MRTAVRPRANRSEPSYCILGLLSEGDHLVEDLEIARPQLGVLEAAVVRERLVRPEAGARIGSVQAMAATGE